MKVRIPKFKLIYEGKDITADMSRFVDDLTYTDNESGESDEITIGLHDIDDLWKGPWFPLKGDKVKLELGYNSDMIDCGTFTVDEIEFSGPPDRVVISALSAGVKSPLRTKNNKAYEKQTLKQIAEEIAKKYGFQLVAGDGNQKSLEIKVERVTQNRETDLSFLKRIGLDNGILFSVRDTNIVFTSVYSLEEKKSITSFDKTDLISFNFKDKATKVYKSCVVKYLDPKTGKVVKAETKADDTSSEDVLEVRTRVENLQQAENKSKAYLHDANSKQQEGNITIEGNTDVMAGVNVDIYGIGGLSGKFKVKRSTHTFNRGGGYTTSADLQRLDVPILRDKFVLGDVLFDNDSAVIKPEGYPELAKVIDFMNRQPNVIVRVEGHTDSNASDSYNMALSQRRVDSCVAYLVAQGILKTRLKTKAYGETKPVASNATAEGRAKNRRTEFIPIGTM